MTELALDKEEWAALCDAARRAGRTEKEQAQHWLRLGRRVEDAGVSDRVLAALTAELSPDDLRPAEQAQYLDALMDAVSIPTPEQEAFFRHRREHGLGVGLNEAGELVGAIDADRQ